MAYFLECESAGIDITVIERFEKRINRLLADMDKYGLELFCGSACSIRYHDGGEKPLILGDFNGRNAEGGCGSYAEDDNGLLRGE